MDTEARRVSPLISDPQPIPKLTVFTVRSTTAQRANTPSNSGPLNTDTQHPSTTKSSTALKNSPLLMIHTYFSVIWPLHNNLPMYFSTYFRYPPVPFITAFTLFLKTSIRLNTYHVYVPAAPLHSALHISGPRCF
jgi:hypothetical protein